MMTNHQNCILIVDDEERGREALEMFLATENYHLAFASNGQEALEQADKLTPDLILLDVMMPGMDGFEVCERLRTHTKLAEVPIIMLTALDERDSRLRGIEVGADDFITKPFDRVELRIRIRTIIRLNRHRRLLTERSRFEWVVEQSEDGYLLLSEDDSILYANSSARLYLKLFKDNLVNERFLVCIEQLYKRESETAWENWPHSNIAQMPRYLVRPETSDDTSLWLQVDILELPAAQFSGQLVRLHNITDHMNLQRQMWSFQTLVSHKLRAPLNGLVSLQILGKKDIDLTSERAHSLLDIARESAKRLQEQILEILQYVDASQLLKSKYNSFFNLNNFHALLTKIKWDLQLDNFVIKANKDLHEYVLAFSEQALELILRELLTNAKKFHPHQTPAIEIAVEPVSEHMVKMTVFDDGRHLSEHELAKVWTPYYQSEKSFTGEVKGMGLGLAMVSGLIWSSGGECYFKNRTDQIGIAVELILPLQTENEFH